MAGRHAAGITRRELAGGVTAPVPVAIALGAARHAGHLLAVLGRLALRASARLGALAWAWSRPYLRLGCLRARDAVLARCHVRKIIGDLMLISWPAAYYAEAEGLIPVHRWFIAGCAGVSLCKLVLILLDREGRRGWRTRGGKVIAGGKAARDDIVGRLDAHDEKFAELFQAMNEASEAAGLSPRDCAPARPRLWLAVDNSRDSA